MKRTRDEIHAGGRRTGRALRLRRGVSAALLALAAFGPRAGADWLVTREGGRVETRGPWQVRGKLLVFTAADGTLASLRLAEVDLEASARASREAKQALAEASAPPPQPPAAASARGPVRSITDRDVGHPAEQPAGAAGPAGRSPVAVGAWRQVPRRKGGGIDLVGSLANAAGDLQTDVGMTVTLVDDAGRTLGTARAALAADSLPAGGATRFRAEFPGVFTFARAKFDIQSAGLLTPAPGPPPGPEAKAAGDAPPL